LKSLNIALTVTVSSFSPAVTVNVCPMGFLSLNQVEANDSETATEFIEESAVSGSPATKGKVNSLKKLLSAIPAFCLTSWSSILRYSGTPASIVVLV